MCISCICVLVQINGRSQETADERWRPILGVHSILISVRNRVSVRCRHVWHLWQRFLNVGSSEGIQFLIQMLG